MGISPTLKHYFYNIPPEYPEKRTFRGPEIKNPVRNTINICQNFANFDKSRDIR
jgi:hypothetical protein